MRFKLLAILWLASMPVLADWTGVAVSLSDTDTQWNLDGERRDARGSEISFRIEERTQSGLSVGARVGHVNLRVRGDSASETDRLDTQFFEVYLRQPFPLSDHFGLHLASRYRYHTGSDNDDEDPVEIDWRDFEVLLGLSLRLSNLRITPFALYQDADGDLSNDSGTFSFESEDNASSGVRIDLFTEPTAFVRLEFISGNRESIMLSFAREL